MRRVIREPQEETVTISEVTSKAYIGIVPDVKCSASFRGFITRERLMGGNFVCRAVSGINFANGWLELKFPTLHELLNELLDKGFGVYTFGTAKELMKWLSEGDDIT